ncbi:conserved hypothetical protein [methanotrophic bacterial endosymbiont of Bathymodiolus sp.]|nr:conserved hypothetical protein [methanotrophic bacterial endosymbiont of Bathymodiolus sp.]
MAQYKIASDESAAKIASIHYKKNTHEYYINLGNTLLSSGKSKDAALAYQQAKKIEPFSLQAEYGIRKTGLLDFSEEKQFDPVIAHAHFAELNSLAPAGVNATDDPHIRYAQALFLWQTGNSSENTEVVKNLLLKVDPEAKKHSAALTLLGEIALQQDDLDLAIVSFNKALIISPHHWSAINNLAYAYQQRAEQYFAQSDAKKRAR